MKSQYLDFKENSGIYPVDAASATTGDVIVDTLGYEHTLIICQSGALTTDTPFQLMEGDQSNLSDAAAVADADLNGSEPTLLAATDNEIAIFEYIGNKRYLRIDTTAGAGLTSAAILLLNPRHKPTQSQ